MFKCNFCPLKYANKSNRSRHEREKHFVEKRLIVIDAMSVHSRLKWFQFYKIIFFTLMVNLEVFVIIVIWDFIRPKTYQLIY